MSVPLIALSLLFACGSDPQPAALPPQAVSAAPSDTPAPANMKRFDDPGFQDPGYHFYYPPNLRLEDHSASAGLIRADLVLDQEAGFQVRVMDRGSSDSFPAWVDAYLARFMEEMGGHHGGELRELGRDCEAVDAGEPCKLRVWMERGDGQDWLMLEYLWPMGAQVLVFQGGMRFGDAAKREPIFDAVARTVEIR